MCQWFARQSVIDCLRERVTSTDMPFVQALCVHTEDDAIFRFGIHLLQGIVLNHPDSLLRARVLGFLEGLWAGSRHSPHRGTSVIMGLLNFAELPVELHDELFSFVLQNWEYIIANNVRWCEGAEYVLPKTRARLGDPRFPASKRWIYLVMAWATDDKVGLRRLMDEHESDDAPLVRRVVAEVRSRLR
jgi:hypothetical protein